MQEDSFIPEPEYPSEFLSVVGYFGAACNDAAAVADGMLEASEQLLSDSRGTLCMIASLSVQRRRDDEEISSFWSRQQRYGTLVREERRRSLATLRETLRQAPADPSTISIAWSRRRSEEHSHFPLWYLSLEQNERVQGDDYDFTVASLHLRSDLIPNTEAVVRLSHGLLDLWCARSCYHAIVDLAPEQHTRGGFCYRLQRYRPILWPRLVPDELWRSLGAARRNAVRVSYWGTYLSREIIDQLGNDFLEDFNRWPEGSDRPKPQSWTEIARGALLLLSDNIFDVSEFGGKGTDDLTTMWEGADDHCSELAAWLRLRLQKAGVIIV